MDLLTRHLEFLEWSKVLASISARAESRVTKLHARTLRPAFEAPEVAAQLERTGEALTLLEDSAPLALDAISDVRRAFDLSAEQQRSLSTRELRGIASTLLLARSAAATLLSRGAPALAATIGLGLDEVEEAAEAALAEEVLARIGPYGVVADDASELLSRVRRELGAAHATLQARLAQLLTDSSIMLAVAEFRPVVHADLACLKVKREEIRRVPGPILGEGRGCYFVAPDAAQEQYNQVRHLRLDEQAEVLRIARHYSGLVSARSADCLRRAEGLITCDLHQAFARYSRDLELSRPELTERALDLELISARHPLLAERGSCEPIDVRLDPQLRLLVVTGPNGGGKTAALKTVGLAAALAQVGCYVPAAAGARLPLFARFLTVAESKSSVTAGVSTFQAHARDLSEVAEASGPQSLILLDEIGVGTDPGEAAALAQAYMEHALQQASLVLATTHLAPLKVFAQESPGAGVAMVELDEAGLPTFKLAQGQVGRSYALEVARRAGLASSICDRAEALHRGQA